jgi:transposase-like protein
MEVKPAPIKVTRKRQYYDVAYKRNAVELALREGYSVRAAAAVFNVSAAEFYRWRRDYGPAPTHPRSSSRVTRSAKRSAKSAVANAWAACSITITVTLPEPRLNFQTPRAERRDERSESTACAGGGLLYGGGHDLDLRIFPRGCDVHPLRDYFLAHELTLLIK